MSPESPSEKPAFVHVSRLGFFSCQSDTCKAKTSLVKGVHRLSTLHKSKKLCPHLDCVASCPGELQDVLRERSEQCEKEGVEDTEDAELFAEIERILEDEVSCHDLNCQGQTLIRFSVIYIQNCCRIR